MLLILKGETLGKDLVNLKTLLSQMREMTKDESGEFQNVLRNAVSARLLGASKHREHMSHETMQRFRNFGFEVKTLKAVGCLFEISFD